MPETNPGHDYDDSAVDVPPIPEANPVPDEGHEPPPQGATQDDTPAKIYPTDPTGVDPHN